MRYALASDPPMPSELTTARVHPDVHSLRLLPVEALTGYEQPDPVRVAQIFISMTDTGIMVNPIVVDEQRRLIIDGHHRREALRWMGTPRVPVFPVRYLSEHIVVKGWSRFTTASPAAILDICDALSGGPRGAWRVIAEDDFGNRFLERSFKTPLLAAAFQHRVSHLLADRGYPISFAAHMTSRTIEAPGISRHPLPVSRARLYIDPVVDKSSVLDMVSTGQCFPHQVNRHLVDLRPIELRIPLTSLHSNSRFASFIDALLAAHTPFVSAPGLCSDGRFYEERTTVYRREPQVI